MKQTKSQVFLIILLLMGIISCTKDENIKEVPLKVINSQLAYQGEISDKSGFDVKSENDTAKCTIRTVFIMKGDTLNTINASILNNSLSIRVATKPYYIDDIWDDLDQFTKVHDVKFNVIGLKKGVYHLHLTINNVSYERDNFLVN